MEQVAPPAHSSGEGGICVYVAVLSSIVVAMPAAYFEEKAAAAVPSGMPKPSEE